MKKRSLRSNIISLKYLVSLLMVKKWIFVSILLLSIVSSIMLIIGPLIFGSLIDTLYFISSNKEISEIDISESYIQLTSCFVVGILVYVIVAICSVIQNILGNKLCQQICFELRNRLYKKILCDEYQKTTSKDVGDLLSLFVNDVDLIGQSFSNVVVQIVASSTTLIFVSIVMAFLNWLIFLLLVILVPVIFLIASKIMSYTQVKQNEQQKVLAKVNAQMDELVYGHELILANGFQDSFVDNFSNNNQKLYEVSHAAQFSSRLLKPILDTINMSAYVLIVVIGAILAASAIISISTIQIFIQYLQSFMQPIINFGQINNLVAQTVAAVNRIVEYLEGENDVSLKSDNEVQQSDSELQESAKIGSNSEIINDNKDLIAINDVSFSYDGSKNVLKSVSLNIPAGSKVSVVGKTGCGKTTLVKLIMGLYKQKSGEINALGVSPNTDKRNYMNLFSYVSQNPWIFPGTIEENIAYSCKGYSEDELIEAAQQANIYHIIQTLPNGFKYQISEDTNVLSDGQLQLINIARAIMANRPVIILDEATSSIDSKTEQNIMDALDNLLNDKTSIIVAHRLSTIINSDIIVVVKAGQIIDFGTHTDLINRCNYYNELFNSLKS